jgi:hypothetical protein
MIQPNVANFPKSLSIPVSATITYLNTLPP